MNREIVIGRARAAPHLGGEDVLLAPGSRGAIPVPGQQGGCRRAGGTGGQTGQTSHSGEPGAPR